MYGLPAEDGSTSDVLLHVPVSSISRAQCIPLVTTHNDTLLRMTANQSLSSYRFEYDFINRLAQVIMERGFSRMRDRYAYQELWGWMPRQLFHESTIGRDIVGTSNALPAKGGGAQLCKLRRLMCFDDGLLVANAISQRLSRPIIPPGIVPALGGNLG